MSLDAERIIRDSPIYWFDILAIARRNGDYERAAEAQRELERLGVQVRFRSTTRAIRKGGPHVA
jgi:hypothetical protein